MKDTYLNKLHNELLLIMDEIHRICFKHKLTYYLCGGSLLGAIRHNGFIPWDDDLDIMMPRKDFDLFISIAEAELNKSFYLDWFTTNKKYTRIFAKVCLKNTLFQENHSNDASEDTNWGIFVDVFPLDKTNHDLKQLKRVKRLEEKIGIVLATKEHCKSSSFLKRIISKIIPRKFCQLVLKILSNKRYKKELFYTRFGSQYSVERVCAPISSFEPPIMHTFENRYYMIPNDYNLNLNTMFGSHYMEIPPADKRRSHFPRRVIFSDGTEMVFDKPDSSVSIEESIS